MSKPVKILVWVLVGILCLIMLFSGYKLATILYQYHKDQKIYSEIGSSYVKDNDGTQQSTPIGIVPEHDMDENRPGRAVLNEVSPRDVDFHSLITEVNPEICGWLYCEGTKIDYPVVQHTDNQFYLTHNARGDSTAAGAIYIDSQNFPDFTDVNTILHGHHMNDGSMFGRLGDWGKQDYFDAHNVFYLNTPSGNYRIQMIAYLVTPAGSDAYRIDFAGEEDIQSWLSWIRSESLVSSNYVYQEGDRLISLSTCMYQFANARGYLMGYLTPLAG